MYIKTVTQKELKDILIEDYVNKQYYKTYYAILGNDEDRIRLFDSEDYDNMYKIQILPCYWEEQYRDYCVTSAREYLQQENENVTWEEIDDLATRTEEDKEQYRDYISLAKDYIEIDNKLMEIWI
jgi:hypothetical protein